jgi:hypothetical protein
VACPATNLARVPSLRASILRAAGPRSLRLTPRALSHGALIPTEHLHLDVLRPTRVIEPLRLEAPQASPTSWCAWPPCIDGAVDVEEGPSQRGTPNTACAQSPGPASRAQGRGRVRGRGDSGRARAWDHSAALEKSRGSFNGAHPHLFILPTSWARPRRTSCPFSAKQGAGWRRDRRGCVSRQLRGFARRVRAPGGRHRLRGCEAGPRLPPFTGASGTRGPLDASSDGELPPVHSTRPRTRLKGPGFAPHRQRRPCNVGRRGATSSSRPQAEFVCSAPRLVERPDAAGSHRCAGAHEH